MAKMSIHELVNKIQWEGGIHEALIYGIRSEHIQSEEVAAIWMQLEENHKEFDKICNRLRCRLPEAEI